MANEAIWYNTTLPLDVIDSFLKDKRIEQKLEPSTLNGDVLSDTVIRDSKSSWVDSNHWIAGFCYHFILKANEENFKYNINSFGDRFIQYTSYEKGHHYKWHTDSRFGDPTPRKLSLSLQLSNPEDYTGGQLEFITDNDHRFMAPKSRGSIIVFDSRVKHRVRKVTSGCRKSIVGWVEGPAWQ
jgi:predicted 2-oxoglutarate/Fe(II)-dependent dioxygenase YbiX